MRSVGTGINYDYPIYLSSVPQGKQRQDSVAHQLSDLVQVANRLGMYDAADFIDESFRRCKVCGNPGAACEVPGACL